MVLDGTGYYQEKGKAKQILKKNETIKCASDVLHWHGASTDEHFVQLAITSNAKGPAVWKHAVTDKEYRQ